MEPESGWLYLPVLLDLYSRLVVGWAMSDRIDTELALSALRAAASTRVLAPNWIHHTDRDCRYGSDEYLAALRQLEARPSMSRKGDYWDNAVAESFFATLEKELLAVQPLQSRSSMRQHVADFIDNDYAPTRMPNQFTELPAFEAHTTEYRRHGVDCAVRRKDLGAVRLRSDPRLTTRTTTDERGRTADRIYHFEPPQGRRI